MGIKILIADDESDILLVLEARLKTKNYDVITASDGEQALEKIIKEKPDIILLDNAMPKLDGAEVAAALKKHELTKNIPIVMVSGKGEMLYSPKDGKFKWSPNNPMARKSSKIDDGKSAESLSKAYGVDDYVAKPFEWDNLFEVISNTLKRSRSKGNDELADD